MKILEIREVHRVVFGPITVSSTSEKAIKQIEDYMKTVDLGDFLKKLMKETTEEYISGLL